MKNNSQRMTEELAPLDVLRGAHEIAKELGISTPKLYRDWPKYPAIKMIGRKLMADRQELKKSVAQMVKAERDLLLGR